MLQCVLQRALQFELQFVLQCVSPCECVALNRGREGVEREDKGS